MSRSTLLTAPPLPTVPSCPSVGLDFLSLATKVRRMHTRRDLPHYGMARVRASAPRALVCLSCGLLALNACGSGATEPEDGAVLTSISVSPSSSTLSTVGETVQLTAAAHDQKDRPITGKTFTWTSSDDEVATVDANGLVTAAESNGSVSITAATGGKSGSATVAVVIAVKSVTVEPPDATITVGETVQLSAEPRDAAGNPLKGRAVTWASDDEALCAVSQLGLVTGESAGACTVTATSESVDGSARITVKPVPVASVTVVPAEATIGTGGAIQLTAEPRDADGNLLQERSVVWSSDNDLIALVDDTGLVTGEAVGVATITATSEGVAGASLVTVQIADANVSQDFEAGQGGWYADNGTWEVGTPTAGNPCHQGTRCAGTVLNADYPKNNSRLVSPPIQLSEGTVQDPVRLTFWHWFSWASFAGADQGVVQISVYDQTLSAWSPWVDVGSPFAGSSSVWTFNLVDLTAYSGDLVRVAFLHKGAIATVYSGPGWFIDEVSISGTPATAPGVLTQVQDFEAAQGDWYADNGTWEVGSPTAGPAGCHQGARCAGTVLNANYPKNNSRLVSPPIQLDLGTLQDPVLLKFWHWFSWASFAGLDQGVVQISAYDPTLGTWTAWTNVGSVFAGPSSVWTLNVVDLTAYSGDLVRIAFLHLGAVATVYSGPGWYLDDIEISGTPVPSGEFATLQDFEAGQGLWFADNGVWEVGLPTAGPAGCHHGTACAGTVLNGDYSKNNSRLISTAVQLPQGSVENPVMLRFWHWFSWASFAGADQGVVQIQRYDQTGDTWLPWEDASTVFAGSSGVWTLNTVDLTAYAGALVRFGFFQKGAIATVYSGAGWYLDDIAVGVAKTGLGARPYLGAPTARGGAERNGGQ